MQKKLTISIEQQVYEGLYRIVGKGRISKFLNDLAKPHVVEDELEAAYREMAADEERETEAMEWSENLLSDQYHETN